MKRHINYHKLLSTGGLWFAATFILSSCIKNTRPGETTFNSLQPTVLIPEGGLAAFGSQSLVFPGTDLADTTTFHVNYAATNVAPADETITLAIDPTALATYNSQGGAQYVMFPDSIFSYNTTTVTVKKGNNYTDAIPLIVYPSKVDPSQNYMLPISIKGAPSGSIISGNFGTIYYHLIGNPLTGTVNWSYYRWNASDTSGAPGTTNTGTQTFVPDDATDIEVQSGYGAQNGFKARYVLSFTNTNGVLSNFTAHMNTSDVKNSLNANGITLSSDATIIVADPVKKHFRFTYGVINSAPAPRTFVDDYQF